MSTNVNLVKLAAQGRAYDASRPWTDEEHEALVTLAQERELGYLAAAEWIRNGIMSLEDYDLAIEQGLETKSLEQMKQEAVDAIRAQNVETLEKAKAKAPKAKEAAPKEAVDAKEKKRGNTKK